MISARALSRLKPARIKQLLSAWLGESNAARLHALRFALWFNRPGVYPEIEMRLVPRWLASGEVAVDIGANGADWTRCLSHQVGSGGRVFAFEADPYYARVTAHTIRLMGLRNVTFFSFGLSERAETLPFRILEVDGERVSGMGRVARQPDPLDQARPGALIQVDLLSLDEVARDHPELYRARLVKCDVEGYELMVFQGAREVLGRARPVVVAEAGAAALHGYSTAELFKFFDGLDYQGYAVTAGLQLRPSTQPGDLPEGPRPNRVWIPRETGPGELLEQG